MIFVNVYTGGQIVNGYHGVDYSISAKFSITIGDGMSLEDLKRELFKGLGLMSTQYTLDVKARVNIGGLEPPKYTLFAVSDENT